MKRFLLLGLLPLAACGVSDNLAWEHLYQALFASAEFRYRS